MQGRPVGRGRVRRLANIVTLMVLVAGTVGRAGQSGTVIADVRAAIARQDFARGEKVLEAY